MFALNIFCVFLILSSQSGWQLMSPRLTNWTASASNALFLPRFIYIIGSAHLCIYCTRVCYLCACVLICLCAHVCPGVWRSEVTAGCLPPSLSSLVWGRISCWTPELIDLDSLSGQPIPGVFLDTSVFLPYFFRPVPYFSCGYWGLDNRRGSTEWATSPATLSLFGSLIGWELAE